MEFLESVFEDFYLSTQTIIFVDSTLTALSLYDFLSDFGSSVGLFYDYMTFQERKDTLNYFRSGLIRVLIATDILSRGYSLNSVQFVINYNVPAIEKYGRLVAE